MDTDDKEKTTRVEEDYHYAKFNVKVNVPEYTSEQYESHLKSDDWSKDETDYLVNLALEFDLRWVVMWDRYEYQPPSPPQASGVPIPSAIQAKPRSMEDLKARYYDIAAKTMALHQPLASMSTTEFTLHEKMTKFDADLETTRKKLAETLLARSPDEVKEEEQLLIELKRIVASQEKFAQERKDLYDRLSVPQSTGGATYKTSQELLQLMQTLLSADKNKKRRSLADAAANGPTSATPPSTAQDRTHRQSISGPADKRTSLPGSAGLGPSQRQLSAREEAKFGIAHHDRTQTGTYLRHERISKLAGGKSATMTVKIQACLDQLRIPHRLTMPTTVVEDEYGKLIQGIIVLLDVRKVSEKLENDIKIARAEIDEREGRGSGDVNGDTKAEEPELEDVEAKTVVNGEDDAEGEDEDEEAKKEPEEEDAADNKDGDVDMEDAKDENAFEQAAPENEDEETATAPANTESVRKRSASVVSHMSNKSTRSTKRQKK